MVNILPVITTTENLQHSEILHVTLCTIIYNTILDA
jgi:hypothetical protein